MRKGERGEEHNMTMHFIKIQILSMLVKLLNLACMNSVRTDRCLRSESHWDLYDRPVGSSPPKSPRLPAQMKQKTLNAYS